MLYPSPNQDHRPEQAPLRRTSHGREPLFPASAVRILPSLPITNNRASASTGSTPLKCVHKAHFAIKANVSRDGRPRFLGGCQRGNGTR